MENDSTQITNFKKILLKSSDRNSLNDTMISKISEWAHDTDFDDLISMFDDFGHKINYKIIIELLLLLHNYHDDCIEFINNKDNFIIINELYDECSIQEKDCYKKALINQLVNIINLYNNITKIKTFYDIGYKENNYVMLYRGFSLPRYQPIIDDMKKLDIGDYYTTNTFLSTSVLKNVAVSFISNNDDIENNVLWSIKVNSNYLNELQYSYLGQDIFNIHNLESIIDTGNYESEILLNLGVKLKLINVYEIHNMTYVYKTVKINNKSFIVYEFEFMGWDKEKTKNILNKVINLKNCLEPPYDKTKKRTMISSPTPNTPKTIKKTKMIKTYIH